jgi:DNA-binding SARP family transcriptional activator
MRLGILGSLQVIDGDRATAVGARNLRILLAVLLCHPNRAVSTTTLLDAIWGDAPPKTAGKNLHLYVYRLRRVLGADRVRTYPHGYGIAVEPGELDAETFERLAGEAAKATADGDRVRARLLFDRALGLWRGPALADLADVPALTDTTTRLNEQRWNAVEDLMDIDLALGSPARVAGALQGLVVQHPLRERMRGQLMTALYRSGRQADALAHYHAGRAALVQELGVEPGAWLQNVHLSILRGLDPGPHPMVTVAQPAAETTWSMLPPDLADFNGRIPEVAALRALATNAASGEPAVAVVHGMGGVGKTAVAVHAAHRMAAEFPDGQYFLDLRGFTPGQQPLDPADGLDVLLRASGLPPDAVPHDLSGRIARWRERTARRRLLLVLDNATDERQIEPLLPGTGGSFVIVTTRRQLISPDGAVPLHLGVLPSNDARELFRRVSGRDGALDDIVDRCGQLPLAIRIAAARLRQRPMWTVVDLADRLRDQERRRLFLTAGRRTVFDAIAVSYDHLDPDHQRIFLLLGLHPGTDFDRYAVAALADLDLGAAEQAIDALFDDSLVEQRTPGRYHLHDLVRDCAAGLAERNLPGPVRHSARHRLFDYLLALAATLCRAHADGAYRREPKLTHRPAHLPPAPSLSAARQRLRQEHANLVQVAKYAATHEWNNHAWQIPTALYPYISTMYLWESSMDMFTDALHAARAAGDPRGESAVAGAIAGVLRERGDRSASAEMFARAIALSRQAGDQTAEAWLLGGLGTLHNAAGDLATARELYRTGYALAEQAGDTEERITLANNLGRLETSAGRLDKAAAHLEAALDLARQKGSDVDTVFVTTNLALVRHQAGAFGAAVALLDTCVAEARRLDFALVEAIALARRADARAQLGEHGLAADDARAAVCLARATGQRRAECEALNVLAERALTDGDEKAAADAYQAAERLALTFHAPDLAGRAYEGLAAVAARRGDREAHLRYLARAADAYPAGSANRRRLASASATAAAPIQT